MNYQNETKTQSLRRMMIIRIIFFLLPCTAGVLSSAEDAYHHSIRVQLEQQHDLIGGEWALRDNEAQTIADMQFINVDSSIVDWRDAEPFAKIISLQCDEIRINPWDKAVRLNTSIPVHAGDALLLVIWMNNIDSTAQQHAITHVFEAINPPYDKSLYLDGKIKPGWRQWLIPFEASVDYKADEARFQLNLGHMRGIIQIAGLAVLNYGVRYSVNDLPVSTHHIEYDGREADAVWRNEAVQRIEQIRKGDLSIRVFDEINRPIHGAHIKVDMQRHEFGFGSAISSDMWFDDSYNSRVYRQKLENLNGDGRSFNLAVIANALKWPAWEDPYTLGDKNHAVMVAKWLADRNIKIRGHNLLWPNWEYMPADMQANRYDRSFLINRIQNHIYEEVGYDGIKGVVEEWDVINEMGLCHELTDALGSDDIYADALFWTAESDPKARLFLNENEIIADGGRNKAARDNYKTLIAKLINLQAPLHGIGVQGHMNTGLTAPEVILDIFDEFEPFDLEISITEYDAANIDETLAADYMRDILIAAFSHHSVHSFIMWGFWDGVHWQGDSPIFRNDWSVKPSGEIYMDLVFRTWWTNAEGFSDEEGVFATRAFYGDYSIVIEYKDRKMEAFVEFSKKNNDFVLQLGDENTGEKRSSVYRLLQNHPNPFNGTTTIQYDVPTRNLVSIDLYDLYGRHVKQLLHNVVQPAGRHILHVDSNDLPSGLYYYRLQSGQFRQTKKMLLIK